jgi:putative PIN family toxin of toxin-antitoxin system
LTEKLRRIVFDTNVVLSGSLNPESIPARAVEAGFRNGEVLISSRILEEFEQVLSRPWFNRYAPLEMRQGYLRSFFSAAKPVVVVDTVIDCRDPRDNMFLELALSGRADVIVTGDTDLLCLHPWRGIAILSPADYLAQTG